MSGVKMHESKKCHYCSENIADSDTECRKCGALLDGTKPNKLLLWVLCSVGGCFALFTLWVGYNLFLSS